MMDTSKLDVIELFPIPLLINHLNVDLKSIQNALETNNPDTMVNLGGNFRSVNDQILEDPALYPLKVKLYENARFFLDEIMEVEYDDIQICTSWYNINPKGSRHHKHAHPNSFVSGVFYVVTEQDEEHPHSGSIMFSAERRGSIEPTVKQDAYSKFSQKDLAVRPKPGLLVLFPSTLEHRVLENETDTPRISIAFNVFFKGLVGNSYSLTALRI